MHNLDVLVGQYIGTVRTGDFTEFFYLLTNLFDVVPFALLIICFVVLVYLVRGRAYAVLLALTTVVGSLLTIILKAALNVARPTAGVMEVFGKSFPSGHTLNATIFFVMLIFIFDDYLTGFARKLFNFISIFMIFLVGFSRLYLGVHWLSDVVGAMLIGTVFVYVCTEIFRATTKS